MKFLTFARDGADVAGALSADGRRYIDLAAAARGRGGAAFASVLALIEAGEPALELAGVIVAEAERSGRYLVDPARVVLRAPIPVPPQIRDAISFPIHIRQAPVGMRKLAARIAGQLSPEIEPAADIPPVYRERPVYYLTNRFSVIGPDETVLWPRYSRFMDFELEVAVVLSKGGKDIPVERAAEHIFGYTIYNDFSARDAQLAEMAGMLGPAKGKSFDMGNAMGPYLVTRDEVGDVRTLRASARVNGQSWVSDDFGAMLHSFEQMIAYISRDETLYAGEIIGSGTVSNGCGLEQDRYLEDGDLVELEVDRLGTLRNRVVRQPA